SGAATLTGHRSSRRASSSALIAEISAITAATCSPRASRARTATTSPAGTYRARPRPAGFGVKYAYGPCGSPPAHRHSARPHPPPPRARVAPRANRPPPPPPPGGPPPPQPSPPCHQRRRRHVGQRTRVLVWIHHTRV